MPRECVTVQIGQCGNQIGSRFWDMVLSEHANHGAAQQGLFDESMSTFFRNVDSSGWDANEIPVGDGRRPITSLRARAVLVDMEEGVVNEVAKGPLGELFDQRQYVTDVSGSGNNWAHGHEVYGRQYRDAIMELLLLERRRLSFPNADSLDVSYKDQDILDIVVRDIVNLLVDREYINYVGLIARGLIEHQELNAEQIREILKDMPVHDWNAV